MAFYTGIVEKGLQHASWLGFHTANIPLDDPEPSGVYAAMVKVGEEEYEAVAFADQARHILEAHLLDFEADLYGWNVRIELVKKIRDRKKFADEAALKRAIMKDMQDVRQYFRI